MRELSGATERLPDPRILDQLPPELVELLANPDVNGLDELSQAALQPPFTDRILSCLEPVFVGLAAQWLSLDPSLYSVRVVSALSRILPVAPYLQRFALIYLEQHRQGLPFFSETKSFSLDEVGEGNLLKLLLALFRLLSFDLDAFSPHISPIQLQSLFTHENAVIRYLSIRCFGLYMEAADAVKENMLLKYLGDDPIPGKWEEQSIDYRYLGLREEKRWKTLMAELDVSRKSRSHLTFLPWINQLRNAGYVAEVGDVLVPTANCKHSTQLGLVKTPTAMDNLRKLGYGLLTPDPMLLIGPAGSGKTSCVLHAAHEMGHASSMITLHLNEQTDSKSLLGVYSTSPESGGFVWQPGVLTKAAKEGRWVLVEDLDRAPPEVMGLILPLVENRELVIPSRKEHIRCAQGFRVIATMRSSLNSRGEEVAPDRSILGSRLWRRVRVAPLPFEEIKDLIREEFPLISLTRFEDVFLSLYRRMESVLSSSVARRTTQGRYLGLRDLLNFCRRIERRLKLIGVEAARETIPESTVDEVFLDAVDCFAAYLSSESLRSALVEAIAAELNMSPQRMHFCLSDRLPAYSDESNFVTIGREVCPKITLPSRQRPGSLAGKRSPFATTKISLRTMEQVAAALQVSEPMLLVGETGIGKTAVVQQLATLLRQRLTVVNLSQQSETTDLLGGYKPVNLRSIAVSLVDEFNSLFESTFSARKNQKFLSSVSKSLVNGNWLRLINVLKEAVKMASGVFDMTEQSNDDQNGMQLEQPSKKKRKLNSPTYSALRQRWKSFAVELGEFEARASQEDTRFSFAFVQGKIVKALRNGEWVLLDEINLASPDTLESIASLLDDARDGGPSVLLSEVGDVEQVFGHPDFRIFGAMNPATDAGKRDLAPALRSRFTELFVQSPDSEIDDLLCLIESYLGPLVNHDRMASSALANVYLETKRLGAGNKLVDGAGQKPHFSVRTLVRTLLYVTDQAHVYGLRRAIYEGFCMSFLTLLSKDSERQIIPLLDKHVFGDVRNSRSILSQTPREPSDGGSHVQFKHYWMQRGSFTPEMQPHYILTPFIERNLLNLVRASSTRRFPILLQGPTSSGKTSMVEYLAKLSGNRFVRINNHEHTDLQEYLGSYVSGDDGSLYYQEGVLVEALRQGYWIVLDELNLAPTDVLEALNRLLDDNRELFLPETQEVVRPHQNFMLFATQNPAGLYGGRKVLSRAFRNRFLELHFDDIPEDELEFILKERSQIAPSFCTRIVSVYRQLAVLRQSNRLFEQRNSFATLRDLFRWALRRADDREQLAINGFMLLGERVRDPQERDAVRHVIEKVMGVKLDEKSIYGPCSLESRLSRLNAVAPAGIIWTQPMRRLFILVSDAIEHNEPVLLVGETGCGKTQLCQAVAEAYGKGLSIVNAHVNLETGDLIGAQRPLRNRAAIEQQLLDDVSQLLRDSHVQYGTDITMDDAKSALNALPPHKLEACDKTVLERVRSNLVRAKALFEWSDGSLVEAMKSGQFFLLDELSLADDSVLERLNSVLEPQRSLLLAEKGPVDSSVVAKEGFQFLSTMNPGGDYGKRELSAALRNRLTEIWVPPLSEAEDIIPIVESKLMRSLPRAPEAMLEFAKWFKERPGETASVPMSVRDLLAWVNFVNTCESLDTASAIVHGACMVYIDSLGANPSAMLAAGSESLDKGREACLGKLGLLFSFDALSIYARPTSISIDTNGMAIGPFHIAGGPQRQQDPNFALDAPTTLANTLRISRGLQSNKPILVEGSPGVGKTTLVAALAGVLGKPLTRINLSEQTDLTDLFGSDVPVEGGDVGRFAWSDAPFLRAMQRGGWVLLDEMNLASQSVLEGLNSCLDHRQQVYIAELDQTFKRHPDFVLFAAQNPHHQGGGRKGLPTSFVNRFTVVYADSFTPHDLRLICGKLSPNASFDRIERLVNFISSLNIQLATRRLGATGGPWEMNLRDLSRWFKLLDRYSGDIPPWQFLDVAISQRFRTDEDRCLVAGLYAEVFGEPPGTKSYFHNLGSKAYRVGLGLLRRNQTVQQFPNTHVTVTTRDLPVMEALLLCLEHAWPTVLVGTSGCGKTSILRKTAALAGAKLIGLALNSDTDAMDLVGGFEQRDIQRQLSAFVKDLCDFLRRHILLGYNSSQTPHIVDPSLRLYQELSAGRFQFEPVIESLRSILQMHQGDQLREFYDACLSLRQMSGEANKVGFEWTDGLLVDAMQRGDWVVLDNANLCDSSVLDRLNSLMEPDGCLIINEQRMSDGSAKIVRPHPNFRLFLTMDPRFGELSRAMRNRAVEIFFLPHHGSDSPQDSPVTYTCESSLYRLRQLHCLNWHETPTECRSEIVGASLDHISEKDLTKADDVLESFAHELPSEDDKSVALSTVLHYKSLVGNGDLVRWQNMAGIEKLDVGGTFWDCRSAIEPLHPLVNEPRLCIAPISGVDSLLVRVAKLQELQLDILRLRGGLTQAEASAGTKKPSEMNPLELSTVADTLPPYMRKSSRPFAPFLFDCSAELAAFIHRLDSASLDRDVPSMLKSILQFCWDIFRISQLKHMDEAGFQAYVQIGRGLLSHSNDTAPDLISGISQLLDTFRAGWILTTGLSMQRMWDKWRPATPSNLERLHLLSRLREVCTQFDQVFLETQLSHSHLGRLRRSLIETQSSVLLGANASDLVSDLGLQINSVESHAQGIRPTSKPHFSEEFEALCQYHDLFGTDVPEDEPFSELLGILELLAGRPSRPDDISTLDSPIPQLLSQISSFSGFKNSAVQTLAVRGNICLLVLGKLSSLGDVSLNQMDLLTSEMGAISRGLAWTTKPISIDQVALLRNRISSIFEQLLICHQDQLEPKFLEDALSFIKHPDNRKIQAKRLERQWSPANEGTVRDVLHNAFARSLDSIATEPGRPDGQSRYKTGEACIALALACLQLFVPDRPFDPSLGLVVEQQRYAYRVSVANRNLDGLKFYETFFTGRRSNLRVAVAEDDVRHLGSEPPHPPVIRPADSQLSQLHGEFRNILSGIMNRTVDDIVASAKRTDGLDDINGDRGSHNNLLQRNIRQICLRLTTGYNAYEDISIPVVRFLQLLDLGMSLVQQSQADLSEQRVLINEFSKGVPLLGDTDSARIGSNVFPEPKSVTIDVGVHRLSCLAVAQNTNPDALSAATCRSILREIISKLHHKWKSQLEKDQAREAEKSSLYHYKFSDEDELSAESDGISKTFPTFEGEDDNQNSIESPSVDPKALSRKLSQFTKNLFSVQDKELAVRRLIMDSAELIGKTIPSTPGRVISAEPKAHLSAVLLKLEDAGMVSPPELYNFYVDPNVTEAKKLVQLVEKVLQRFTSIQKSWPEHATLGDVVSCCLQVLQFKHFEPLAKLITKTEQLHAFVNEWQSVASREFSVADCYNDLTALIISWRRLELSTWACLLDIEKEKCETDASGWWFVAYEVIIAAPLQLIEDGSESDMRSNTLELVNTLQKFVQSTNMGQFAFKLQLIERLKSLLDVYAIDFPSLACISAALNNLVQHYSPFVPIVENVLSQGRQSLEKDIKQQIQLASWKDVNIAALRESARRSHNKLFRIVRKYRHMLGKPCDSLLEKGYPSDTYQEDPVPRPPMSVPNAVPSDVLTVCRDYPAWRAKSARFKDPNSTMENMRQVYRTSLAGFEATGEIDLFTRDVVETIKSFREKTPKTLTEDNKEEVQHLKTQKRRYYADKLRDLRHMGFQSNLGTDTLNKQSSVESVLVAAASLPLCVKFSQVGRADFYFHRLLDLLPRVRVAGRNYAEDLSNVEAGRSAGFVEALLFRVLKQREKVASFLESWGSLEIVVEQMANASSPQIGELRPSKSAASTRQELQRVLRWLETVLGVCGRVLQIQLKFAGSGANEVLDELATLKRRCSDVLTLLDNAVSLPPGISSGVNDGYISQAQHFLHTTKSDILRLTESYPEFAFALEQLLPWTESGSVACSSDHYAAGTGSSVVTFDCSLTSAVDKIFVALQRLKASLHAAPSSAEDQGWLIKSDQTLSHSVDELHMKDIATSIGSALGELSHIPDEDRDAFIFGQASVAMLLPLVQQYQSICFDLLHQHASLHREVCKMGYLLASSFTQVASEGFCSPTEASNEQGKSDKLEDGTGLGEGGGAEDISKDVQDDEDLTDLAQQKNEVDGEQDEMEEAEDAVNMDNEELEADDKETQAENEEKDDKGSEGEGEEEEENLDEEVGSVDGLDSSAVDEKLWDGANDEEQKDTENNEGQGSSTDDKTAASEKKAEEADEKEESKEDDESEEPEGDDEGEAVGREDVDVMDPHAKDDQVLDLPDDMQLDGQDNGKDSDEDDELDDLSMADKDELDEQHDEQHENAEDNDPESPERDTEMGEEQDNVQESEEAEDGDKQGEDLAMDEEVNQDEGLKEKEGDEALDSENVAPSEAVSAGLGQDQDEEKGASGDAAQDSASAKQSEEKTQEGGAAAPEAEGRKQESDQTGGGTGDDGMQDSQTEAFKKLGDILQEWHRRQRNIKEASEKEQNQEANHDGSNDVDMENAEFEHLADEQDAPDTQALGQAEEEQVRGMDQSRGVESDAKPNEDEMPPNSEEAEDAFEANTLEDQMQVEKIEFSHKQQQQASSFIANESRGAQPPSDGHGQAQDLEDLDNVDTDLSAIHLSTESEPLTSADEARRLWSHYESVTHDLSLSLTEQLRLILAPTMATKLRGDFRTGKRLNIKRIIPYIASQYKRDKIWMRRSVPSKRSYQIMLAVDDSKSMLENGSGQLAFETLALVSKSLSMLEAGDLCIVGFGNEEHIRVAHEFGKPFSSEAGMQVFQQFSYKQTGTNVRKLVADAITLFREARAKQSSTSRTEDLWQLQLIISDGVCEHHDVIRRLVRQAQEERIMIVFIIVDAVAEESRSIMNLTQASFEPDESGTGDGKWKMKRYLDDFPFPYYLVVRDVQELPGVLSLALKQWFAEVVEISA